MRRSSRAFWAEDDAGRAQRRDLVDRHAARTQDQVGLEHQVGDAGRRRRGCSAQGLRAGSVKRFEHPGDRRRRGRPPRRLRLRRGAVSSARAAFRVSPCGSLPPKLSSIMLRLFPDRLFAAPEVLAQDREGGAAVEALRRLAVFVHHRDDHLLVALRSSPGLGRVHQIHGGGTRRGERRAGRLLRRAGRSLIRMAGAKSWMARGSCRGRRRRRRARGSRWPRHRDDAFGVIGAHQERDLGARAPRAARPRWPASGRRGPCPCAGCRPRGRACGAGAAAARPSRSPRGRER